MTLTTDAREAALVGLRQMLWAVENGAELAHVEVVRDLCGTHTVSVRLARQKQGLVHTQKEGQL
jgi:hypothetical protein